MTGFGKAQNEFQNLLITVEIKSVNNRFKDIRFKMPNQLSSIEIELKKELSDFFQRGSFDVYINIKKADQKTRFDDIDETKVNSFIEKMGPIFKKHQLEFNLSPVDFLRSEFFIDQAEEEQELISQAVKKTFINACEDLKKSRLHEGEKLHSVLVKHLDVYKEQFKVIESFAEVFKKSVEEKLLKKVEEYKNLITVDQGRLLQEVIFYLEKIDVHEEINRVHAHLEKFQNLLESKKEVGRQIDFFIQELNRETNTIGSKSNLKEISNAVVQMKVQLEKMREQGLNIE